MQNAEPKTEFYLPNLKEDALEDALCAVLASVGFYIEPNVEIKTEDQVKTFGEIDIIARRYTGSKPKGLLMLVEAKSGKWGAKDIMQLCGHMRYLNADCGWFVCPPTDDNPASKDILNKRFRELGMYYYFLNPETSADVTIKNLRSEFINTHDRPGGKAYKQTVESWRFSWLLRRKLLKPLKKPRKNDSECAAFKEARNLRKTLTIETPLIVDPLKRLKFLSEKQKIITSRLSSQVAYQCNISGATMARLPYSCLNDGDHVQVQSVMLLEMEMRLAVTAALTDAVANGADGSALGFKKSVVSYIAESPDYRDWPRIWQSFLYCWGGFFLERDKEIQLLAEDTASSEDSVEKALRVWDELFPVNDGWFKKSKNNIQLLQLVPAALRGAGIAHRAKRTGKYKRRADGLIDLSAYLECSNDDTYDQIRKWHNLALYAVDPQLTSRVLEPAADHRENLCSENLYDPPF